MRASSKELRAESDVSEETVAAASQGEAWCQIPFSTFDECICSDRECGKVTPPQALWSQFEAVDTSAHACFLRLCLDLGQVLWQRQRHHLTNQKKA